VIVIRRTTQLNPVDSICGLNSNSISRVMLDDAVSALGVSFWCCADGCAHELLSCITTVVSAVLPSVLRSGS
jgi:hypothetical protein